jgi:hypothetical protein
MATEAEIKSKERKRAAVAQSEGILGAAERGEYGDVGQGGEKGPFDDEINQDPNKMSNFDFLANYFTSPKFSSIGLGVDLLGRIGAKTAPYTQKPLETISQGGDSIVQKAAKFLYEDPAKVAAKINSGVSFDELTPGEKLAIASVPAEVIPGLGLAPDILKLARNFAVNVGKSALKGIDNITQPLGMTDTGTIMPMKMSDEGGSSVVKSSDEVIVPRQIKVISGTEPDLTKLIIKKDGKDFVNIGSATNNRLIELDKVKLVKDELIEKGRSPRDLYRFALKTSDDDLRFAKKDDVPGTFVMVSGRKIPVEFTTKQKDISGKSYRTINPEAQKIGKGGVPSGEPTVAQKFRNYYAKNFTDKKSLVDVANKDTKFRFFDNKRRTMDDVTPEEFFSNNSLKDLEKGGKFHNEYLKFKAIDDVRIKYADELKPILQKMFTKVREGTVLQKKSKANLQLAHKFETSGIKKGYVSPTKTGKGTDPSELYLDISEYNAVLQKSLEKDARKFYKIYIESGDEVARKEFLKIDKDMRILGIEGQVAPGQTVGKAMPFDDKIRQLADEAINNKFITQKEYDKLINAAEEIAEAKIKFFDTFGVKASYKYGGMVEINHLTRPLGNF